MQQTKDESVLRQLMTLAWPIVLAFMMQTSYNLVDLFWVGKLGATSIAAVSLAGNFFYIILALGQVIGSGTVALVAHSYGARLFGRANTVAKQSILLAFATAFIIGTLAFLFSGQIMSFLGGRDAVLDLSTDYLRIVSIGFFFQLLSFSINYIFRGAGDMKIPMLIMLIATVLNLVLDPLLILGIGFFPRLEVGGAAIATTIAKFISFCVGIVILVRGRSGLKLETSRPWNVQWTVAKKIFSIGIPVGISYGLMAASIMAIFGIVAGFSEHALAALGIGTRIFQFASLPVVGIGVATTTLVGQRLGARNARGAAMAGNTALRLSSAIMFLFIVLFIAGARNLMGLFTQSAQTVGYGVQFMHIVAFYLIFVGISTTLTGVYRGAGYTTPPMVAGVIKVTILYALALLVARAMHMGVTGVWWSMLAAYGVESIVLIIWYRRGTWRAKGLALMKGMPAVDR
ncbi:MAG: MATE family efflux transporter [candidate division WOR-3 bacterium]|nr:MAG: MATE family efflux transporter [candidate division WOR-3 bacterium]